MKLKFIIWQRYFPQELYKQKRFHTPRYDIYCICSPFFLTGMICLLYNVFLYEKVQLLCTYIAIHTQFIIFFCRQITERDREFESSLVIFLFRVLEERTNLAASVL